MRYLPLAPALMAVGAMAAPRPQLPNYAEVDALLPEVSTKIDVTAKPTIISYDITAAIESVAEATNTAVIKRATTRILDISGCGSCKNEPTIPNYYNVDLSTDNAFLACASIAAAANGASTPNGYTNVFTNKQASLNGHVYMGYEVWNSGPLGPQDPPAYNPAYCAYKCNEMAGCQSFNICKLSAMICCVVY